jgi:DNA-directed RNA polymerase sigma subunit (sigma70/sigma32)
MSYEEIAKQLGMSIEMVRTIERVALNKLRKRKEYRFLRQFLEPDNKIGGYEELSLYYDI